MSNVQRVRSLLMLLLMALVSAPAAIGQEQGNEPPKVIYDQSDFVHLRMEPIKTQYFLGEPVVLPLKILNHTRSRIDVRTNLVPGSMLDLRIRAAEERQRTYRGPFQEGEYVPGTFVLDPLDELPLPLVVYADRTTPNRLAFPKVGKYTITVSLNVEVDQTGARGAININPFEIEVTSTPQALQPLVNGILEHKLTEQLHFQLLQPENIKATEQLLANAPPSPLTPFVAHALGKGYLLAAMRNPGDKTLGDNAIYFLNLAYLSKSRLQFRIAQDLVEALDKLNRGPEAQTAMRLVLDTMNPALYGKIGLDERRKAGKEPMKQEEREQNLFYKYTRSARELLPIERYWPLFN